MANLVLQPCRRRRVCGPSPGGSRRNLRCPQTVRRAVLSEKKLPPSATGGAVLPDLGAAALGDNHRGWPSGPPPRSRPVLAPPLIPEKPSRSVVATMEQVLTAFVERLNDDRHDPAEMMPPHWVEAQLENLVYHQAVSDRDWMARNDRCAARGGQERPPWVDGETVRAYSASHKATAIVGGIVGAAAVTPSASLLPSTSCAGNNLLRGPELQRKVRLLTSLTEFLYTEQVLGFREMAGLKAWLALRALPTTTAPPSDGTARTPDPRLVGSKRIMDQLSILKAGGYWKYLTPTGAGDLSLEQSEWEGNDQPANEDEERENCRPACGNLHNVGRGGSEGGDDFDEHDEDGYQARHGSGRSAGPATFLAGSVLTGGSLHPNNGFCVNKITRDGWLCSEDPWLMDPTDDTDSPSSSARYLLRLPWKVAKLGQEGMSIRGVDLRQRRDNGALEPCNGPMMNVSSDDDPRLLGTVHLLQNPQPHDDSI